MAKVNNIFKREETLQIINRKTFPSQTSITPNKKAGLVGNPRIFSQQNSRIAQDHDPIVGIANCWED